MIQRTTVEVLAAILGLCLPVSVLAATTPASQPAITLHVSPAGSDADPGTIDKPFATVSRARDAIRALKKAGPLPPGGVCVELRGGVYELYQPLALTAADAGSADAPIEYRARLGEAVRVLGGKQLSGWKRVGDAAVLAKLDPAARGKVLQTDLKAAGVKDFGQMGGGFGLSGGPGLELFFRDQPMTLARYPNDGFIHITAAQGPSPVDVRGTKGTKEGMLTYDDDRPARWVDEKNPMVLGYWFWDWAEGRQPIARIDPAKHYLELKPPWHNYGYRKGQWFYGYNLLCEIDRPGEWYLDRETGILYFWPPAAPADGDAMVTVLTNLLTLNGASYVSFRGLTLEGCRGDGITMTNCTGNRIAGCTIRNLGGWAVHVKAGSGVQVIGCDIYATGDGGIGLDGGDRKTLAPAGHLAENNHIHDYSRWNRMYRPAIMIGGVGQHVAHNLIDNAPHMAIGFGGNDHVIEYNEIHSVCYESNDAGAMYAGRNWTMRGTVIRYNYLHDINGFQGRGCVGVYLDDQWSGTTIFSNLFVNVTRAAMIGGGRDCTIENNIFVDCVPATHVDARGLGWAAGGFGGLKNSLLQMPYKQPPWSERYPRLVNILDDDPMAPKGNTIARNICVGGRWGDFERKAKPMVAFTDNLLDQDPLFVDAAKRDFRLKDDSPALKLGFKPLPYDKMGLYQSDLRASWPVEHPVRPMTKPPAPKPRA